MLKDRNRVRGSEITDRFQERLDLDEIFSDKTEAHLFELSVGAFRAWAEYSRDGGILTILHVVADYELRGSGAAGRLMQHIADAARAAETKIKAQCPYAASWFERHPAQQDLLI
jgi:predicted GNAT family acetyltransferase